MNLAELLASGRATCKLEEIVRTRAGEEPVLSVSRCVAYEQAAAGELPFVVRVGRRYLVSVPALLRFLQVPLPDEWRPPGACAGCCQREGSETPNADPITSGPTADLILASDADVQQ